MSESGSGTILRSWWQLALRDLAIHRSELNALNVYPVPDGDTGTNMYLTAAAGFSYAERAVGQDGNSQQFAGAFAEGALLGARGNSGVILSQICFGVSNALQDKAGIRTDVFAHCLHISDQAAQQAVADPVEGTILTVLSAAAAAADVALAAQLSLSQAVRQVADAAYEALLVTPKQLPVLASAGVVDAGGRGLVVLLDALQEALTEEPVPPRTEHQTLSPEQLLESVSVLPTPDASIPGSALSRDIPDDGTVLDGAQLSPAEQEQQYEVMFLFQPENFLNLETDAAHEVVRALKTDLLEVGDSVMAVGGKDRWHVHVHVPDVERTLALARTHGELTQVTVSALPLAQAAFSATTETAHAPAQVAVFDQDDPAAIGVVAVAHGPGVAAALARPHTVIVAAAPLRRPSTAEILAGIRHSNARHLFILPSDRDSAEVAELAAARAHALATPDDDQAQVPTIEVIPTRSVVQTLAAVSVLEPDLDPAEASRRMRAAAAACRYIGITIATRAVHLPHVSCEPGDVIGIVDGLLVAAAPGGEIAEVSAACVRQVLADGVEYELATIIGGSDVNTEELHDLTARIQTDFPQLELASFAGGQPMWPVIIGIE